MRDEAVWANDAPTRRAEMITSRPAYPYSLGETIFNERVLELPVVKKPLPALRHLTVGPCNRIAIQLRQKQGGTERCSSVRRQPDLKHNPCDPDGLEGP
jgi:hypothetical protein